MPPVAPRKSLRPAVVSQGPVDTVALLPMVLLPLLIAGAAAAVHVEMLTAARTAAYAGFITCPANDIPSERTAVYDVPRHGTWKGQAHEASVTSCG